MAKILFAALLQIFYLLIFLVNADALPECGSSMTPDEAYERATAVFSGRVSTVTRLRGPRGRMGAEGSPYDEVKLEVEQSWKLIDRREITIVTQNIHPGNCGSFSTGETYLVYADRLNDVFFVSASSRTNRLAEAEQDLKVLGEARLQLYPGQFRTYKIIVYGTLVSVLFALLVGIVLYRLSKKPFRAI